MTKRVSSRIPLWAALGTLSALVIGLFTPVGWGASSAAGAETPTISVTGLASEFVLGQTDTFTVSLQNFTETDGTGESQVDRVFQVTMSASGGNGTLTLKSVEGISESPGVARSGAATIRFTGTLEAVNAAMAGMTYSATTAGSVTLSVSATHVPTVVPDAADETNYVLGTPVRWAGNGHFYQYVKLKSGYISWSDAKAAAEARKLLTKPGYLATLTSAEENAFVANEIAAPDIWIGATDDHTYIDAFTQQTDTVSDGVTTPGSEGKWTWVTGPEAQTQFMDTNVQGTDDCRKGIPTVTGEGDNAVTQFNSWDCGEPNNALHSSGYEHFAVTNWEGERGKWNDLPNAHPVQAFLVEYSEFDDPESATATVSTTALAVPSAPTTTSVTPGNQSLSVAVTVPEGGGELLTNFRYSTDGGVTFRAFSPAQTTSPLSITTVSTGDGTALLQNGTAYSVVIQSVYNPVVSTSSTAVSGTPVAPAPTISSVTPGNQSLSVALTVPEAGLGSVTNFRYSTDGGTTFQAFSPAQTTSPLTVSAQSTAGTPALQNGTAYSIVVQAVYGAVNSASSSAVSGTPVAPRQESTRRSRDDDEEAPATTPAPTNGFTPRGLPGTNNGATNDGATSNDTLSGPFSGPGGSTTPPIQPIAFIGGQPSAVQTSSSGSQELQVQTGGVNLGFGVQSNQGSVTTGPGGSAELGVVSGGSTKLEGSGLQPGSSVQLFLPSLGPNSSPLAQIPVGPNGEFSGDVSFTQSPTGPAMPIGRHVLQVASVNAAGERVVVEITVNIAQGDPTPELNRRNGVVPTLTPGQSLATSAGLPVPVTLTVDSSQKSTLIEGEGWTMGFTLLGSEGAVGETSDGGALMNLVRNSSAEVTGDGFMPGTRLDVFLFSEPTLLGSVTIDDSGSFSGEITIDGRDVPVGNHTLQIQGVGSDGFVRASNLGVTVGDPVAVATSTEQAASSFLWWLIAIAILVLLVSLITWWAFQRRSRGAY